MNIDLTSKEYELLAGLLVLLAQNPLEMKYLKSCPEWATVYRKVLKGSRPVLTQRELEILKGLSEKPALALYAKGDLCGFNLNGETITESEAGKLSSWGRIEYLDESGVLTTDWPYSIRISDIGREEIQELEPRKGNAKYSQQSRGPQSSHLSQ